MIFILAIVGGLLDGAIIAPMRLAWECPGGSYETWGYWPRVGTVAGFVTLDDGETRDCGALPCFCVLP